ncbi:hypothetical protein PAHAL_1G264500 [Panicum hallii]|uniref:Uncharacterized protein n=1 Tax=Panicum hallii TaxID=206008 RepID=A0A2T8KWE9_9POAL|nr:hypothetical protein PAHAL_1G264500 [Panicum hallii]
MQRRRHIRQDAAAAPCCCSCSTSIGLAHFVSLPFPVPVRKRPSRVPGVARPCPILH